MGGRGRSGASQERGTVLCEVQGCQVMLGLGRIYRRVRDIAKEVNKKACAAPAEGCSLPALCSIFLLFLLQLIYKTCQVFIPGLFGVFFLPLHSGTREAAV